MRRLYLCGAGNAEGVRLAMRINEATRRWDELVLLDDDPDKLGRSMLGIRVAGPLSLMADADPAASTAVNLVARTTTGRAKADLRIASYGLPLGGLISADVDLLGAEIASDVIAYQNATIGPEVVIGPGCVVFMGAVVGHECRVGHHCVIAANAVLNARVVLGDGVYVGSSAVVIPEVKVGAGATVGAGAVVISDVPAGATVVGSVGAVVGGSRAPSRRPAGEALSRMLTAIWSDVLGVGRIEPNQNFFDLGGTSLLALRTLQEIEARLGTVMSPVDLYQYPTVSALAAHLGAASGAPAGMEQVRLRALNRSLAQSVARDTTR